MVLDFINQEVYTIVWKLYGSNDIQGLGPEDLVEKKLVRETPYMWSMCNINLNEKVFVCDYESIYNHINHNLTDSFENKNVYVDKNCNIPTIDLQKNGVIRKKSVETADLCIVPKLSQINKYDRYVILYNPNDNTYVILKTLNVGWNINDVGYRNYYSHKVKDFADQLISYGILDGYNIIYHGSGDLISSSKKIEFFTNYHKYKNCIYENDYIVHLNKVCEDISLEEIESIKALMTSRNKDNINMGLQMLYSYDPRPYAYTIVRTIESAGDFLLKQTPFWKSSKFSNFLSKIGLTKRDLFCYSDYYLMNKLFDICNDYDKEKMLSEIFSQYNSGFKNLITALQRHDFLKDIVVEPAKIYYDGKDYCHSGE